MIIEIGLVKVDALIKKSVDSIDDLQELRKLSIRINEAKEKLILLKKSNYSKRVRNLKVFDPYFLIQFESF